MKIGILHVDDSGFAMTFSDCNLPIIDFPSNFLSISNLWTTIVIKLENKLFV